MRILMPKCDPGLLRVIPLTAVAGYAAALPPTWWSRTGVPSLLACRRDKLLPVSFRHLTQSPIRGSQLVTNTTRHIPAQSNQRDQPPTDSPLRPTRRSDVGSLNALEFHVLRFADSLARINIRFMSRPL
jgi:hypothetical protein